MANELNMHPVLPGWAAGTLEGRSQAAAAPVLDTAQAKSELDRASELLGKVKEIMRGLETEVGEDGELEMDEDGNFKNEQAGRRLMEAERLMAEAKRVFAAVPINTGGKMTLREVMTLILPEIVPGLSPEEADSVARRHRNGELGRPDVGDFEDVHALDDFNVPRLYGMLEVMDICARYEALLDFPSMTHEEGELMYDKIVAMQDSESHFAHSPQLNAFKRVSPRNSKAIIKLIGKPCDPVQVLQMFHEAYDSDEERDEDANNKKELFPILRRKFERHFVFKADGRNLTYHSNHNNSLRRSMISDFWFNLRGHWTRFDVERRHQFDKISNRDKKALEKIGEAYDFASETGFLSQHAKFLIECLILNQGKEGEVNDWYSSNDRIRSGVEDICKELSGKESFAIEEILDKCADAIMLRHRIVRPVAYNNDVIDTKMYFSWHEFDVGQLRDLGREYQKAARFFCVFNAQKLPVPESEGYRFFPPKIVIPENCRFFLSWDFCHALENNLIFEWDKVPKLVKWMQDNERLLKRTLNLTGLEMVEKLKKYMGEYEKEDEGRKNWRPSERYRNEERGTAVGLAEQLLELAKGFDEERVRKPVERIREHVRELESEDIPGAPLDGAEIPPGYDMTECPICGARFECGRKDYFHRAECTGCNEKMFVLPGMSLWNRLVEAGEEEAINPAEDVGDMFREEEEKERERERERQEEEKRKERERQEAEREKKALEYMEEWRKAREKRRSNLFLRLWDDFWDKIQDW